MASVAATSPVPVPAPSVPGRGEAFTFEIGSSAMMLLSALDPERRAAIADELRESICRHAEGQVHELAFRAAELRAMLDGAGDASPEPVPSSTASSPPAAPSPVVQSTIGRPPVGEAPDADVVAAVRVLGRATRAAICRKLDFTVNNAFFRAMPAQLERLAREGGPLVEDGMHGTGKAYRVRPGAKLDGMGVVDAERRILARERPDAAVEPRPAAPAAPEPERPAVVRSALDTSSPGASTIDREILRVCAEAPLHIEDIADAIGVSRTVVVRRATALVEVGLLERDGHRYVEPAAIT